MDERIRLEGRAVAAGVERKEKGISMEMEQGLASIYGIVKRHGGAIVIERRDEEGTVLIIRFGGARF